MKYKMQRASFKNVLDFISEVGMLKMVRRSGWSVLGIPDAESVAEHSFRCAVIGYVLSRMEKISPHKVLLMALFSDIQEARITDLHKMAQRYINVQTAEDRAFYEQISSLPECIKEELGSIHKEYKDQDTEESLIARDADILECLIQAKEYHQRGYHEAAKFMKKAPSFIKTKSARELWRLAKNMNLTDWWVRLSEFKR